MTKKVRLENIVSLQGDDYSSMLVDLENNNQTDCDTNIFEYMCQWWEPDKHDENIYDYSGVNTPFLGYEYKDNDDTFLLSHNSSMGYCALSRILEIYKD